MKLSRRHFLRGIATVVGLANLGVSVAVNEPAFDGQGWGWFSSISAPSPITNIIPAGERLMIVCRDSVYYL